MTSTPQPHSPGSTTRTPCCFNEYVFRLRHGTSDLLRFEAALKAAGRSRLGGPLRPRQLDRDLHRPAGRRLVDPHRPDRARRGDRPGTGTGTPGRHRLGGLPRPPRPRRHPAAALHVHHAPHGAARRPSVWSAPCSWRRRCRSSPRSARPGWPIPIRVSISTPLLLLGGAAAGTRGRRRSRDLAGRPGVADSSAAREARRAAVADRRRRVRLGCAAERPHRHPQRARTRPGAQRGPGGLGPGGRRARRRGAVRCSGLRVQPHPPDRDPGAVRTGVRRVVLRQHHGNRRPRTTRCSPRSQRPGITAILAGVSGAVSIDGTLVDALAGQTLRGPYVMTTTTGAVPAAPGDVLLGTKTMQQLGVHIGSTVRVTFPSSAVGPASSRRFTVVGTTVLPPDFNPRGGLGTGAIFTLAGFVGHGCPSGLGGVALPRVGGRLEQRCLPRAGGAGNAGQGGDRRAEPRLLLGR